MDDIRDRSSHIRSIYKGLSVRPTHLKPTKGTLLSSRDKQFNIFKIIKSKQKQKAKEEPDDNFIKTSKLYKELQMQIMLVNGRYSSQIDKLKQTQCSKTKEIETIRENNQNKKKEIEDLTVKIKNMKILFAQQQQQYYYLTNQAEDDYEDQNAQDQYQDAQQMQSLEANIYQNSQKVGDQQGSEINIQNGSENDIN